MKNYHVALTGLNEDGETVNDQTIVESKSKAEAKTAAANLFLGWNVVSVDEVDTNYPEEPDGE